MTTLDLTRQTQPTSLELAGAVANGYAARSAFGDYRARRADNTLRRQDADLALFAEYLADAGIKDAPSGADLAGNPAAWQGMTWGLVAGWARWQLARGYAVASVNVRLSTVRSYAKLAAKAGALDAQELALIRTVEGYSRKEAKRINERRAMARLGSKKAEAVSLTPAQAKRLKTRQPDTPQGRRDAVLVCILLDHGLRASELAGLKVTDVDLAAGMMTFYRPKVDKVQSHKLTRDTLAALRRYFDAGDAPAIGPLLRASAGPGRLTHAGMSTRNLSERVRTLGADVGAVGLSAHDCRHYWATQAARNGTALDRLQDAGGWSSYAMPLRYVEAAAIANEGVTVE